MRALAVAWVVVLSACSKKTATVEPVDAGVAQAPSAALERPAPTSPSTLSVLEPVDGKCLWRQEDPVATKRVVVTSFPGSCLGARLAWSHDGSQAVVWFDPQLVQRTGYSSQTSSPAGYPDETADETAKPRFFRVATRTGKTEPFSAPAVKNTELKDLGVTEKGDVVALLSEPVADGTKSVTSNGETFDVTTITEGLPVLVHAYRLEGADWKRIETKLSSDGWDYGLGVGALDANRALGPRSVELLDTHAQGDSPEGAALEALTKHAPKKATSEDDGHWIFLGVGGARVSVWEVTGEFAHTTGLVVANDQPLAERGFTDGDLVALRSSGPHLLISNGHVGTHPRLYEFPSGKLVYRSDTARAVTFWPTTAKPESHERP